jgi:hypothetical protein
MLICALVSMGIMPAAIIPELEAFMLGPLKYSSPVPTCMPPSRPKSVMERPGLAALGRT